MLSINHLGRVGPGCKNSPKIIFLNPPSSRREVVFYCKMASGSTPFPEFFGFVFQLTVMVLYALYLCHCVTAFTGHLYSFHCTNAQTHVYIILYIYSLCCIFIYKHLDIVTKTLTALNSNKNDCKNVPSRHLFLISPFISYILHRKM